ncbi:P-loop containing nucleoside triphosphate hydrolase protein [Obelidium mucronatum]|nr:P-loop containing nucleoside triphosphate hydrolase protein [Obelidium mucronatum]
MELGDKKPATCHFKSLQNVDKLYIRTSRLIRGSSRVPTHLMDRAKPKQKAKKNSLPPGQQSLLGFFKQPPPQRPTPSSTLDFQQQKHHQEQPAADAATINTRIQKALDIGCAHLFNLKSFRGDQGKIVAMAMQGKNVLVIMPTGAGKSLTYQLPSVISTGVSIIISPLLGKDDQNQVDALQKLGVNAATLNSTLKESDRKMVYKDLSEPTPKIKMLYVTPELMATDRFREILKFLDLRGMLARLAHCISEWGHDFRGDYRKLTYFKMAFPRVPIMALTATATASVRQDILKQLDIEHDHILFISSFNRPNLDYQVRFNNTDRYDDVKETIYKENAESKRLFGKKSACGIIYCGTRESCESLATRLQADGINAQAYHAAETISCDIVIATVAFGMGIDKKDVRFVLHWDLAQSMEAYYQQAGRAGRDGLKSRCILYYTQDDKERIIFLISKSANDQQQNGWKSGGNTSKSKDSSSKNAMKAFEDFIKYCENRKICRHIHIMNYFGEDSTRMSANEQLTICEDKKMCDVCRDPKKVDQEWCAKYGGGNLRGRGVFDESIKLPNGTWVTYSAASKRKEPTHNREISMVDDDGNDSRFERAPKRTFYSGYAGFKTASGKTMEEAQDLRMKLFGLLPWPLLCLSHISCRQTQHSFH